MSGTSDRIREKVQAAEYDDAYSIGRRALENSPSDHEVALALRILTAELRRTCMDLAVRKMDYGREYDALEYLLREASKLTGQDMYGRTILSLPSQ